MNRVDGNVGEDLIHDIGTQVKAQILMAETERDRVTLDQTKTLLSLPPPNDSRLGELLDNLFATTVSNLKRKRYDMEGELDTYKK